jgi:branched-subunit amino acid aminotransferase/4-amino-4-deoxychorismate lyase
MKLTDFIIYNGEKFRVTDKIFDINNRALRYGDGFFESVISFYDNVPFWGNHFTRIKEALSDYGMSTPDFLRSNYLLNELDRLRKSNKFFGKVYSRISFFREGSGKYLPNEDVRVSYLIEQKFLGHDGFVLNSEGLKIDLFTEYKKPVNKWAAYKKISAELLVIAAMYASSNGFDDVLIFNEKGKIIESTNSNVFVLSKSGNVYTPSINSGCVKGVMRSIIINLLKKNGIKVFEVDGLTMEHINEADELFLTNAVVGVKWVKVLRHKRFLKDLSSRLVEQLNEIYVQ